MAREDFAFFHTLRVRWSEVDMQSIVFNGHYLNYFDVAFTEYWRHTGLPNVLQQAREGREMLPARRPSNTLPRHASTTIWKSVCAAPDSDARRCVLSWKYSSATSI